MGRLSPPGILLCWVVLAAATCCADVITSHLGHQGTAFAPGMTPSALGWGPDDKPYPDKFVVNPQDGAEMVWVPAGEFMMGSTPEEQDYAYGWGKKAIGDRAKREWVSMEGPQHKVRITKGFWLYRHTVTNAQYRRFRADHNSGEYMWVTLNDDRQVVDVRLSLNGDRQPVVRVSWNEARDYCHWAGVRFPTEAEWEYACRAGTQTKFWWGDGETEAGKYANVADRTAKATWPWWTIFDTDDGYAVSAPVGRYQPNAFGLYDMIGNVWQWCADWYDRGYYAKSPADDPPGPSGGQRRVERGGSWNSGPHNGRSASRGGVDPGRRFFYVGFRCARTP